MAADLTDCDREPIHVPGAIQPHGLLLVATPDGSRVVAGAGDLERQLAPDWLGRPLGDLLRQDVGALVAGVVAGPGGSIAGDPVDGMAGRWTVTLHRSPDHLLAELESLPHRAAAPPGGSMIGWLNAAITSFGRSGDLSAMAARAAVLFRQLTGFDRVMIYRFLDDDAGRVVAEDRDPALGTFLHHHFPASDIPRQARALYVRNRTRTIVDAAYVPAPLRPAGFAALDLSDVALRSVSPVHLQYLRNMGVAASASISIVTDGVLWGLVACHHNTPRLLPHDLREAATALAGGLAQQIRAREEAESYRERLRLRAAEDALRPKLGSDGGRARIVEELTPAMAELFDADGFAYVEDNRALLHGKTPTEAEAVAIAAWVRARDADPFATRELAAAFPEAEAFCRQASGLLAIPLAEGAVTLLWFRAEQVEEIEWAGNPHKAVARDGQSLSPRASFQSWTEEVRGRSRRWSLEEVESAHRLRRAFDEAAQARNVRRLNRELQASLAEKDAAIAQKDVLMREVNHRVQNSLQLVSAFLALEAKAAGDPTVTAHLAEAQARLSAVALVHRRLYHDEQVETVDLARYLTELVGDLKVSIGPGWAEQMTLDLAPVLIPTDRAVTLGLILTELVINATKYAYGGAPGPIAVALEQHRQRLRLVVADHGGGITGSRQGFGSRMMTAMVARLSGTIEQVDNAPGLRVILTAPIEDAPR